MKKSQRYSQGPGPRAYKKIPLVNSSVIKPGHSSEYAQVLKILKHNAKPAVVVVTIRNVKKMLDGSLLIAFKGSNRSDKAFYKAVRKIVLE